MLTVFILVLTKVTSIACVFFQNICRVVWIVLLFWSGTDPISLAVLVLAVALVGATHFRCHFYFYDNFGKCGPIIIILSLLDL